MKTKTFYSNVFLISLILFIGLVTITKSVYAIDQTKRFYSTGSYGNAKSWGVWQEGQYYRTESEADTFYYLAVKGRGWFCCDSWGDWYLNEEEIYSNFWSKTTRGTYTDLLISEWEGVSNGKHYAQKYPGAYFTYIYTSEDSDWDTATCYNDVNDSSCN